MSLISDLQKSPLKLKRIKKKMIIIIIIIIIKHSVRSLNLVNFCPKS